MKKILWILMTACLLFTGCTLKDSPEAPKNMVYRITASDNDGADVEIFLGMTYDDVFAACSDNIFDPYHYAFLKAQNGQTILVTFRYIAKQHRIYRIEVFDARDRFPSEAEFNQITRGMTISEVTALLGKPSEIPQLSGLYAYRYLLDDGTTRNIIWNYTSTQMTVLSY